MEISNKTKFIALAILLSLLIVALTLGGTKYIYKAQMRLGFKGKITLIEECMALPGCAISTDEPDLLNLYARLQETDVAQELGETDLIQELEEVEEAEEANGAGDSAL